MLKSLQKQSVKLLPGLFRERMEVNKEYLMELDSTCLLQNFYLEAGVILPGLQIVEDPAKAKLHWGWEAPNCHLRGHFLGHWLSAAAALVANEGYTDLKAKLEKIVSELKRCQELNGGEWVGSIPEKYFEFMAREQYVWSPQYTMHKTIMGLIDVYRWLHIDEALEILNRLADWYLRWVREMNKRNPQAVYSGEQAGMLQAWAMLLEITGDGKYLDLVCAYEDNVLFRRLDSGEDALTDEHANASIPLAQGAARLYELTDDDKWRRRVMAFWKTAVTDRGMYCTTGSNSGEFWIPPHKHGEYMGKRDQEFCTVYNMVRVAEYLYRWTGDAEYAEYIEKALYNGFLAQQNRRTGMPAYFLPLTAGSRKIWGSKTRDFWCCHGTMVQGQTLYPDLIWYSDENKVIVSQYIPSCVKVGIGNGTAEITQTVNMKNGHSQMMFDEHSAGHISRWSLLFAVETEVKEAWTLSLRIPGWSTQTKIQLNGEDLEVNAENGYAEITRVWCDDTLDVIFTDAVHLEPLPDLPEYAAFVAGPIVLAGLCEQDGPIVGECGDVISKMNEHTYDTFLWKQGAYRTRHQQQNFELIPLYDVQDEIYTIYFAHKALEGMPAVEKKAALEEE